MSVPIREWLDKLISTCARKDVDNQFTKNQTIEKNITIKNSEIDYTTPPTAVTTGTLGDIKFNDLRDGRIASIEAYRSLAEDLGIRLRVKDKYLGFRVSDENITTSYVDHPYEEGPNNQIATIKYVQDKIAAFDTLLNRFLDSFTKLDALANEIINSGLIDLVNKYLKTIETYPHQNSGNLVTSGGTWQYGQDILGLAKAYADKQIGEIDVSGGTQSGSQSGGFYFIIGKICVQAFEGKVNTPKKFPFREYKSDPMGVCIPRGTKNWDNTHPDAAWNTSDYIGRLNLSKTHCEYAQDTDEGQFSDGMYYIIIGEIA